jgi:hypothetical protein
VPLLSDDHAGLVVAVIGIPRSDHVLILRGQNGMSSSKSAGFEGGGKFRRGGSNRDRSVGLGSLMLSSRPLARPIKAPIESSQRRAGSSFSKPCPMASQISSQCRQSFEPGAGVTDLSRFGPVRRVPLADVVYEDRWGQPCRDL